MSSDHPATHMVFSKLQCDLCLGVTNVGIHLSNHQNKSGKNLKQSEILSTQKYVVFILKVRYNLYSLKNSVFVIVFFPTGVPYLTSAFKDIKQPSFELVGQEQKSPFVV